MPLSSHAERSEIAPVRHPVHAHVLDLGEPRSLAELVEELLQRRGIALGLRLNGAIRSIAHEAAEPQLAGMALGEESEPDTLDVAQNLRLQAALLLPVRQLGVGERAGGHDHGDPLWRIRDGLEGAAHDRQIRLNELAG